MTSGYRISHLQEGLHEHKLLMKGLVNAESRTEGRYKRDWDGRLCEKAELLLSNHIFLVEMNEVQRIAMYVVCVCVCV